MYLIGQFYLLRKISHAKEGNEDFYNFCEIWNQFRFCSFGNEESISLYKKKNMQNP